MQTAGYLGLKIIQKDSNARGEMNSIHSTKELLWLDCREKTCCHNTKVIISGKDLWRISRALDVAPWTFVLYCQAEPGAVDGFQLVGAGPSYQLVLAKRGEVGANGAPCIFLWKLADGHAQCGLGDLRPLACQAYPSLFVDDMLCVSGHACSCRRWSLVDVDSEKEESLLNEVLEETKEYAELVAAWNESLVLTPYDRTFQDFCSFVLDAYCRRCGEGDANCGKGGNLCRVHAPIAPRAAVTTIS